MNHPRSVPAAKAHDLNSRKHGSFPQTGDRAVPEVRRPRVGSLFYEARGRHSPRSPSGSPLASNHDLMSVQNPQSIDYGTSRPLEELSLATTLPRRSSDVSSIARVMTMPHHPRSTVGSAGTPSHRHGRNSPGGSDVWDLSSSVSQAPYHSDNRPPKSVSNPSEKKADKRKKIGDEEPPPWIELKTKAGKDRKRLPLACIACRRKKIKCSGEEPTCRHCLKSRTPCVYKFTARKAAPRIDYMAMLGKGLKGMEERAIKTIPEGELPDLSITGDAVVNPALPTPVDKPPKPSPIEKRCADEAFAAELREWARPKQQPRPENLRLPGKLRDTGRELAVEGVQFLPSKELREHLAEVFFDCIYGQPFLLLHKPTFMRKLKIETVVPLLVLAVCAVSARFSTHPELNAEPAFLRGDQWAAPARVILERRHDDPSMTTLIASLILGLHYFGTCEGGLSWSFGGQAMRTAFALQLHREPDQDPFHQKSDNASELSSTDREIRRRTMWASFLMDRFNSAGTERPPCGGEEYLRIQLPVKESNFHMEIPASTEDLEGNVPTSLRPGTGQAADPKENMGVAAYIIRAIVLWGRIVKYLHLGGKEKDEHPIWSTESGFVELQAHVDLFEKSIPPSLVYSTENLQSHAVERIANQFLYLHLICQQNILFLYRVVTPTAPGAQPPQDMPKQFLNEAGQRVVEAANQISHLIVQGASHRLTAPFAGYCAYVASTIHIRGIFSQNPQLGALSKENLRHNYRYLTKMKEYWGMLHYMAENVKDIYRHFADAASRGAQSTADTDEMGPSLVQYGDWFSKIPRAQGGEEGESSQDARKEIVSDVASSEPPDLQSVEEFSASPSRPPKAERTEKVARRNTKKTREIKGEAKTQIHGQQHSQTYPQQQHLPPRSPPYPQALPLQSLAPSHNLQPGSFIATKNHDVPESAERLHPPQNPPTYNFGVAPQTFDVQPAPLYPANSLPHLDRQLVFNAYTGMDTPLNPSANSASGFAVWEAPDPNGPFGNVGGSDSGGGISGIVNGAIYPQEPSPAWFMPFNMNPRLIGEDGTSLFFGAGNAADSFPEQNMGGDAGTSGWL